jgi:hypothetical protein
LPPCRSTRGGRSVIGESWVMRIVADSREVFVRRVSLRRGRILSARHFGLCTAVNKIDGSYFVVNIGTYRLRGASRRLDADARRWSGRLRAPTLFSIRRHWGGRRDGGPVCIAKCRPYPSRSGRTDTSFSPGWTDAPRAQPGVRTGAFFGRNGPVCIWGGAGISRPPASQAGPGIAPRTGGRVV